MTGLKNIIKGVATALKNLNLSKLPNALQSINTDKVMVDISQDDVGLFKDNNFKLSDTASYAISLTIPSNTTFKIPPNKEVVVSDFLAEGDLYAKGDLLVL